MSGKAFAHRSAKGDFFETPYSLTRAMMDRVSLPRLILEPASGNGAIVRVLQEYKKDVHAYDVETDFLKEERRFPGIVTNPPFSMADQFVSKAISLRPKRFAYLLRTNYLSGQSRLRAGLYRGLSKVMVFDRMPDLRFPIREDGKFRTGAIVYAWFIWDRGYIGKPRIDNIPIGDFVLTASDTNGCEQ